MTTIIGRRCDAIIMDECYVDDSEPSPQFETEVIGVTDHVALPSGLYGVRRDLDDRVIAVVDLSNDGEEVALSRDELDQLTTTINDNNAFHDFKSVREQWPDMINTKVKLVDKNDTWRGKGKRKMGRLK